MLTGGTLAVGSRRRLFLLSSQNVLAANMVLINMERVVHPGPIVPDVLRLQSIHRSEELWTGRLHMGAMLVPQRVDAAWTLLVAHSLHPRVMEYLSRAGFHYIILLGRLQFDTTLVTAMVERWRPETHTFHMPFGKVTITLQDIQVLFGLSVDGLALYEPDPARRLIDWRALLHMHTGCTVEDADMSGASRVKVGAVVAYLHDQLLVDLITVDTSILRVEAITRLYIFILFGCVLFPNTSGNFMNLKYLPFLVDLERFHTYSWGSAVLAYLYRSLYRAAVGTVRDVSGFHPLVQPRPSHEADDDMDDDLVLLPYARRWTRGIVRGNELHHHIGAIRDQFDMMCVEQFQWTLYDDILRTLPPQCTADQHLWLARVPLVSLDIIEHHSVDRVMRQFGLPQHLPFFPDWAPDHY